MCVSIWECECAYECGHVIGHGVCVSEYSCECVVCV